MTAIQTITGKACRTTSKRPQGRLFETFSYTSLDVVLGTLASAVMAVVATGSKPVIGWWFLLGLAVWIIYNADHQLDCNRTKGDTKNHRHYFHFRFRKKILLGILLAILTSLVFAVVFFELGLLYFGGAMAVVSLLYLFLLWLDRGRLRILFPKELLIALIYTFGNLGFSYLFM